MQGGRGAVCAGSLAALLQWFPAGGSSRAALGTAQGWFLLLLCAPGPGFVTLILPCGCCPQTFCVTVPSVVLSNVKNLLLLGTHCRFLLLLVRQQCAG